MPRFEKVTFNRDNKYDIQLGQGHAAEERLVEILQNTKLELKTENWLWEQTGNICIEYARGDRPSGIGATKADFWVHELRREPDLLALVIVPMERMKALCRRAYSVGKKAQGGDYGKTKVIKLPLSWLWR